MLTLPTCTLPTLYHIGTLNRANKTDFNYESVAGLSVSTAPDAWARLRRVIASADDKRFSLHRDNNVFLDAHACQDAHWDALWTWGQARGFLVPVTRYAVTYFDDEVNSNITTLFADPCEAEEEAEGFEVPVVPQDTFTGTAAFADIVGASQQDSPALILVVYAIIAGGVDGVYWHDELDVLRYRAPRGIILDDALSDWTIREMA